MYTELCMLEIYHLHYANSSYRKNEMSRGNMFHECKLGHEGEIYRFLHGNMSIMRVLMF
jgi:hypothetical protein